MSKPVKYIAIVLVILVVGSAVTGIAMWSAGQDPNAPNPGLFLNDKKMENPPAMLTLGQQEVPFTVYRHYYLLLQSYYEYYYGATFYDEDPDGDRVLELKNAVELELRNAYAWAEIANQEGIALSDEDIAEIEEDLALQKEEYGAGFARQLEDMFYLDDANYLEVAKLQRLVDKTREAYTEKLTAGDNKALASEADEAFLADNIMAKHILIKPDEANTDAEAAKAEALAMAESILLQIKQSEDPDATFDELRAEYTEDVDADGNPNSPEGYVFGEGTMAQPFYDAAVALKEGEMSQPVWNEQENYSGWHIVYRLPIPEAQLEENRTSYIDQQMNTLVDEKINEVLESMPVTYPSFYDEFKARDIR